MSDTFFKNDFLNLASKLDAVTNSCGEIIKVANIIAEKQEHEATVYLLRKISTIQKSEDIQKEVKTLASALKDSMIKFYGYYYIMSENEKRSKLKEDKRTLEELLKELNNLIGLENVKSKVNDLIAYQKVQVLRKQCGLHTQKGTLHMAFIGNPGTGKTTVARIVGHVYKQIGLLSKGHFVEVSRTDLIAGYQGQTALKVKKVIEQAKGGVLFIDEAYSITENDHSDSYGRECLTELTKALEDYRDDLVVIVAGYTEPMKHFFASNPGLKSRFNIFIEFSDYSAAELFLMFEKICSANDYTLSDDAKEFVASELKNCVAKKNENFANGRLVRNIYESSIMNHARRVSLLTEPTKEQLSTITKNDIISCLEQITDSKDTKGYSEI